jgi:hypothetical protein
MESLKKTYKSTIMMLNISLNAITKRNIELSTGIPYEEIELLDAESIEKRIEENKKKPIIRNYGKIDRRLPMRGMVYLSLKRYIKMSDISKRLSKI